MKISMIFVSFFLFMLCLTHVLFVHAQCPKPVPEKFAIVQPGNIVAAYFGGWDKLYRANDIEPIADVVTHVLYAFIKPNVATGKCELDIYSDVDALDQNCDIGGHFGQLRAFKKKHPKLKILLSIGGGTAGKELLEIAQKGMLETFAKSAVDLLDSYRCTQACEQECADQKTTFSYQGLFDGVDLDWEWSKPMEINEYAAFYQKLVSFLAQALKIRSEKLKKKSLLTCALQANPKILEALQLPDLVKRVDWFHVMTYDFGGPSGPGVSMNAPICNQWSKYSIDNTISFLMEDCDISPAKLVLGIPLYGYAYDQAQEKLGSSFARTEKTKALGYSQIKELYIDNPSCHKKWHKKSHVPYAYCPDESIFVTYDDERSVSVKVNYAKEKKLQGVFFWRLALDDDEHNLIKAVKK